MSSFTRPSRREEIAAFKKAGGRIAAVLPIHYPRALLRAHGFLPVEVWGPSQHDPSAAMAHLPAYTCSIVRHGLAFILEGGIEDCDLVVVPHCCDTLQGLGSLLRDLVRPRQTVLTPYLPRGERAHALAFLERELAEFSRALVKLSGTEPSDKELCRAIEYEERADGVLARLHLVRADITLEDPDFFTLLRCREYLTAERFVDVARPWLDPTVVERSKVRRKLRPLVLSGILPEPVGLLAAIDRAGARVVANDLACCGRRLYQPGSSKAPLTRLAESLLSGPPDPMLGSPIADRVDHLRRLVQQYEAAGVLFAAMKFCEPEQFDLPELRAGLQRAGVPSIVVEVDQSAALPQQVVTRIQAFVEMEP